MNKPVIYTVALMILLSLFTFCDKGFPDEDVTVSDVCISSCKTRGNPDENVDNEYIIIRNTDNYYILFSHINSIFNCEPGEITVSIEILSNTISINENESGSPLSDCICPYDLEFRLGPLRYGEYVLIFRKRGQIFREYTLAFRKTTDVKVDI